MDIQKLLSTQKTVFTTQQIGQILHISNFVTLRRKVSRWGKQGLLKHLHYGIRGLQGYSHEELANILKSPSYISLETVLYKAGVVFQYYGTTIFSFSTNTKTFVVDDVHYMYHKLATEILLNPKGIVYENGVYTASVERAICDRLYLTPGYYFDNLRNISWDTLFSLAEIYQNKRLILDLTHLKNASRY